MPPAQLTHAHCLRRDGARGLRTRTAEGRAGSPRPEGARAGPRSRSATSPQRWGGSGSGAILAEPCRELRRSLSGVSGGCVDGWREGQSTPPLGAACGPGRREVCRFLVIRPTRNRCAAAPCAPAFSCPWASHPTSPLPLLPSALPLYREADELLRGGAAPVALAGRSACGGGRLPLAPCPSPVPCPAARAGLSSSAGAGGMTCSEAVPYYIRPCSGASCRARSCFPSALCKLLFGAACFLC